MSSLTACGPPRARPRPGYTAIELLVAVSILGALVGLTAGAVQKVRGAVERAEAAEWKSQRALRHHPYPERSKPIKALFIGNSYTYFNELPSTVAALAKAGGARPALVVDKVTAGGQTLRGHYDDPARVALGRIRSADWDFVVLQDQSQSPLVEHGRLTRFYPYARKFDAEVRARGGITMLYQTWKRPDMAGTPEMWSAPYLDLAKELRAELSPAGMAVERVLRQRPDFPFFADYTPGHPTPAGTYLIGCAFYAALYGKSPVGLPAAVAVDGAGTVGVPPADADMVQRAAWDAFQDSQRRLRP